jgi:tetratricopeptide (TPR) repeat protein
MRIVKHIVIFVLLVVCSLNSFSQNKKQYLEFADENFADGDYYGASIYYEKAMQIDSIDIELLFKYAQALRLYNNYEKAEYYYQKVYDKGNGRIHPECVYWLASMQKYNGKYKESGKTWKRVKTVTRDKKSFDYLKAKQETKSCSYARRASKYVTEVVVNNIGEGVNTFDSEFSPNVHDSILYFTSLRADKIAGNQQVNDEVYKVKVYESELKDSVWQTKEALPKPINNLLNHNANSCFSPDSKSFYFTRCDDFNQCKIMISEFKNEIWSEGEALNINSSSGTTTQPMSCLVYGEEVLFFASDRNGGEGKMDIWFATRKNDTKFSSPKNAGSKVNSIDNEITPHYDSKNKVLYFSSEWHNGLGGFDIFKSTGGLNKFAKPENMEPPINTRWNDFYYTIDTVSKINYLASNREGSMYYKSPMCCNDIYSVKFPAPIKVEEIQILTLEDLNKYLPVTLYFHNDCPNPRTHDTITKLNYLTTYIDYIELVPKYQEEYGAGLSEEQTVEAELDISDFFKDYVKKGVSDLDLFTKLLLIELIKGTEIEMTVRGFASPLAKTDYNVKLTGRRISSLLNYLNEFDNETFKPYIESGKLSFVRIPFGEYTANKVISDNVNDQRNSVYSRSAALERKIEIVSVNLANKNNSYAEMSFDKEIHNFGSVSETDTLSYTFNLKNTGNINLEVESILPSCGCTVVENKALTILPGETKPIVVKINPKGLEGKQVKQISVKSNTVPEIKNLSVTFEVD